MRCILKAPSYFGSSTTFVVRTALRPVHPRETFLERIVSYHGATLRIVLRTEDVLQPRSWSYLRLYYTDQYLPCSQEKHRV
jgi:hypothetical protein